MQIRHSLFSTLFLFGFGTLSAPVTLANDANGLTQTTVTVFTTANYPLKQMDYADTVYYLDAVEQLEDAFSRHLAEQPERAEQQAKLLLESPEGKQFKKDLATAYQGVTEGWKLGVMKVPAVVFENKQTGEHAIIYGETNLHHAVQRYRQQNDAIRY